MTARSPQRQDLVAAYFDNAAGFWNDIYRQDDVYSVVHQDRRLGIERMVAELDLERNAPALDVGCGAGHLAVELARRGYRVEAVDRSEAMVKRTLEHAAQEGIADRVTARQLDIHTLDQPAGAFRLVLAIGVLPWLDSLGEPVRSLARVVAPGGYLITTVDHRWGLHRVLDVRTNPLALGLKQTVRMALEKIGSRPPVARARTHSMNQLDQALSQVGLEKLKGMTLGFGPFTFWNRNLLSDASGVKMHRRIQAMADRGAPLLSKGGGQYIVCARKPL